MKDNVPEIFGAAFAKAFAVFSEEVLKLLSVQKRSGYWRVAAADPDDPLAQAPEWVRDAHRRWRAGSGKRRGLDNEQARALVIRNRIALALRRQNLSQADLARRLGKAESVISRILKSPARSRLSTLQQIAKAIGEDVSDLLA